MARRLRVLMIAEAANPEFVSVPLVGWSVCAAMRQLHDVHIVTQVRNREAFLRAGLVEGQDFTAIDSERLAAPLWKLATFLRMGEGKGWTTLQAISALSYGYFERLLWRAFRQRIASGEFDVVHRVTPLTPTVSSAVAAKVAACGVPFVMGPLNGGVPWPRGFDRERRREREWLSYVRNMYKLAPGRKRTLASAAAIIVGSRHTESEIPSAHRARCVYIPENAVDLARFNIRASAGDAGPLRVGFVGRLVPYKGADMLIEAAAPLLEDGRLRLEIVGDGPMRGELEALADRSGAGPRVTFHGWVEHREVQRILASCAVLGFPSIREFGGGVVLEAMALGVVPLVVDYAGPGELVGAQTGFKVPIGPRDAIIAGLRERLAWLCDHPEAVRAASAAGTALVASHFTWERKAEQIGEVYAWVLGERAGRPDPFRGLPDAMGGGDSER